MFARILGQPSQAPSGQCHSKPIEVYADFAACDMPEIGNEFRISNLMLMRLIHSLFCARACYHNAQSGVPDFPTFIAQHDL